MAAAADEARALFDRLQPTLPILLANLVSVGDVGVTYRANLEQLLVVLPAGRRLRGRQPCCPITNIKRAIPV